MVRGSGDGVEDTGSSDQSREEAGSRGRYIFIFVSVGDGKCWDLSRQLDCFYSNTWPYGLTEPCIGGLSIRSRVGPAAKMRREGPATAF